jgi:hypothetical protein
MGDSLPFKFTYKEVDPEWISTFYFTTKSGLKYELSIAVEGTGCQNLTAVANFEALDNDENGEEHILTNKFEMLPIMATVQEAIKTVLKKNKLIKILQFSAKKEDEGDDRRKNIYLKYIKKVYPNAEVTQSGKDTIVKLTK